jgi:hypothetical protein
MWVVGIVEEKENKKTLIIIIWRSKWSKMLQKLTMAMIQYELPHLMAKIWKNKIKIKICI